VDIKSNSSRKVIKELKNSAHFGKPPLNKKTFGTPTTQ
jgi:hypothetical protein